MRGSAVIRSKHPFTHRFSLPFSPWPSSPVLPQRLHAAHTCNPRDFGAKADGTTKDTAAIQSAIDACAAKGGGTVRLTAGTYLSAPIVLKSNITLADR